MKEVLDYLLANDLHGVSNNVEIVKGKNELVTSFKDVKNKIIRAWRRK